MDVAHTAGVRHHLGREMLKQNIPAGDCLATHRRGCKGDEIMENLDALARIMVLEAAVNRLLKSSNPAIEREIRTALSVETAGFVRSMPLEDQRVFSTYVERAIGRLFSG